VEFEPPEVAEREIEGKAVSLVGEDMEEMRTKTAPLARKD
jgi:hypothetical protein